MAGALGAGPSPVGLALDREVPLPHMSGPAIPTLIWLLLFTLHSSFETGTRSFFTVVNRQRSTLSNELFKTVQIQKS